MKKQLIIMHGVPGSGKTYTAKSILENSEMDGVILSTDDYWYDDDGNYIFDFKFLPNAHSWNQDRCKSEMLKETSLIIIDNTNTTKREWKIYETFAEHYGYEVIHEYPTSPWWKDAEDRIKAGDFTEKDVSIFHEKNTHGVPATTISKMLSRFKFY